MAAAAVLDPSVISTYTGFPQTSVQTLIDAPSAELVKAFIESIVPKLQDFEKLKAEKLRQDVELENTVRGSENRVQSLKSSADKAHEELETVRRQLNEKGTLSYKHLQRACMFGWLTTSRDCLCQFRIANSVSRIFFYDILFRD